MPTEKDPTDLRRGLLRSTATIPGVISGDISDVSSSVNLQFRVCILILFNIPTHINTLTLTKSRCPKKLSRPAALFWKWVWIKAASKEAATEPEKVPEKLEEPKVDLPDPVEAGKGASAASGCFKLF